MVYTIRICCKRFVSCKAPCTEKSAQQIQQDIVSILYVFAIFIKLIELVSYS